MNTISNNMISRDEFDAQVLVSSYPPRFRCENKRLLWEHVSPATRTHNSRITFSRWSAVDLPQQVVPGTFRCQVELRSGFF